MQRKFLATMNTHQFKALAKSSDFEKVAITIYQGAHTTVCAYLRCDGESTELSAYNYLRDAEGEVVKFDSVEEATTAIHMFGFRGKIDFIRSSEELA